MALYFVGKVNFGTFNFQGSPIHPPDHPWYSNNYPGSLSEKGYGNITTFNSTLPMSDYTLGDSYNKESDYVSPYDLKWLKFYDNDSKKVIFICDRVILTDISWTTLNVNGYVTGKDVTIDGKTYKCRLLSGGNTLKTPGDMYSGAAEDNEWDNFVCNLKAIEGSNTPTSTDLDTSLTYDDFDGLSNKMWNWWGVYTICQETVSGLMCVRGYNSARFMTTTSYGTASHIQNAGWRPVLEIDASELPEYNGGRWTRIMDIKPNNALTQQQISVALDSDKVILGPYTSNLAEGTDDRKRIVEYSISDKSLLKNTTWLTTNISISSTKDKDAANYPYRFLIDGKNSVYNSNGSVAVSFPSGAENALMFSIGCGKFDNYAANAYMAIPFNTASAGNGNVFINGVVSRNLKPFDIETTSASITQDGKFAFATSGGNIAGNKTLCAINVSNGTYTNYVVASVATFLTCHAFYDEYERPSVIVTFRSDESFIYDWVYCFYYDVSTNTLKLRWNTYYPAIVEDYAYYSTSKSVDSYVNTRKGYVIFHSCNSILRFVSLAHCTLSNSIYVDSKDSSGKYMYATGVDVRGDKVALAFPNENVIVLDSGNRPPNKPSNLSPTDGGKVDTLTPTLSWTFSDPDPGDGQTKYRVIIEDESKTSIVYDSSIVTSGTTSHTVTSSSVLKHGVHYNWKVEVQDKNGVPATSDYASFYIANPPVVTKVEPLGTSASPEKVPKSFIFKWNYSDEYSRGQGKYHIVVRENSGGALVKDLTVSSSDTQCTLDSSLFERGKTYIWYLEVETVTGMASVGMYDEGAGQYFTINNIPGPMTVLKPIDNQRISTSDISYISFKCPVDLENDNIGFKVFIGDEDDGELVICDYDSDVKPELFEYLNSEGQWVGVPIEGIPSTIYNVDPPMIRFKVDPLVLGITQSTTYEIKVCAKDLSANEYGDFSNSVYVHGGNRIVLMTKPFESSDVANRILVRNFIEFTDDGDVPADWQTFVCNNAFDETPTWEEATTEIKNEDYHIFNNTTKTSDKWGVSVKLIVNANDSAQPIKVHALSFSFD